MMIELSAEGETYYLKGTFPSRDIESIKALAVEQEHGRGHSNAEELLRHLQEAHPMNKEWLKPTGKTGASSIGTRCTSVLLDALQTKRNGIGLPPFSE